MGDFTIADYSTTVFNTETFYRYLFNPDLLIFDFVIIDEVNGNDSTGQLVRKGRQQFLAKLLPTTRPYKTLGAIQNLTSSVPILVFIKTAAAVQRNLVLSNKILIGYYSGEGYIPRADLVYEEGSTDLTNSMLINLSLKGSIRIGSLSNLNIYGCDLTLAQSIDIIPFEGRTNTIRFNNVDIWASGIDVLKLTVAPNITLITSIVACNIICRSVLFVEQTNNAARISTKFLYATITGALVLNFSLSVIATNLINDSQINGQSSMKSNLVENTWVSSVVQDGLDLEQYDKFTAFGPEAQILSNSSTSASFVKTSLNYTIKSTDNTIVVENSDSKQIEIKLTTDSEKGRHYIIHKTVRKDNVSLVSDIPIAGRKRLVIPRNISSVTVALDNDKSNWYIVQNSQHI